MRWLPCSMDQFRSAKTTVIWTQRDSFQGIWIHGRQIRDLPAEVKPGEVVVADMGSFLPALRPLTVSDMGVAAPMRLHAVQNELILKLYNYLGPPGQNFTTDSMSRFYRGMPQSGFYAGAARKNDFPDAPSFAAAVSSGTLRDEVQKPFIVYRKAADRLWTVEYTRRGKTLGIEVDLIDWELRRRWNQKGELAWPAFSSPLTRQGNSGRVEVGGARLECGPHPAWVGGNPMEDLWIAGYYGPLRPLRLSVPGGVVRLDRMGSGVLVWDRGQVSVEALGVVGKPEVRPIKGH